MFGTNTHTCEHSTENTTSMRGGDICRLGKYVVCKYMTASAPFINRDLRSKSKKSHTLVLNMAFRDPAISPRTCARKSMFMNVK